MPDLFLVMARRWSLVLLLTLAGTAAACIASLLSPKLYAGEVTALPTNMVINDKARIFNQNIDGLYPELGSADELDRIEGTARLDTLFTAVASAYHLASHYELDTANGNALDKAALLLRKNSEIKRSAYGELKIKVWDKSAQTAAALANALLQTINAIYERLQTENNRAVLKKLKESYKQKLMELQSFESDEVLPKIKQGEWEEMMQKFQADSSFKNRSERVTVLHLEGTEARKTLESYPKLIDEYELAVNTAPKALLVVEQARPSLQYDRPNTSRNVLLAFAASLLFSFLLAVFVESRNAKA